MTSHYVRSRDSKQCYWIVSEAIKKVATDFAVKLLNAAQCSVQNRELLHEKGVVMADKLTRILYVEDEPDIQTVARFALETLGGFMVEICSSGKEALDKAPVFRPQLILLDVMMPIMDGPGTLRMLRALPQFADTPVIFMTAKIQPNEIAGYREIGAVDVIPKPFDPMTLPNQVQAIWERCHG